MKYVEQFGIIVAISFAGEMLHTLIPLPIPASIYGVFILFGLLSARILKADSIRETARFFIAIMPLLFVAPLVSMMDQWNVMRPVFVRFFIISLATTIIVMVGSGWITQFVIRRDKKKGRLSSSEPGKGDISHA